MRFDLHCHSTCSDGSEPAARVGELAAARDVEIFALTDHDTCGGCAAIPGAIRAVEISCDHEGRTIHVLAYDRGGAGWAELETKLGELREARRNRLRVMAARLAQRGIAIDVEPMIASALASGRSLGRPDLANAMVACGAASSRQDAFARHLYDGGPVDVPHRLLPVRDALSLGRAANAAMGLAHPHLYDHLGVQLLRAHRDDGLSGVEAFYAAYDAKQRTRWTDLADELGLVCTAGTDFHTPADGELGIDLEGARADALREWLGK